MVSIETARTHQPRRVQGPNLSRRKVVEESAADVLRASPFGVRVEGQTAHSPRRSNTGLVKASLSVSLDGVIEAPETLHFDCFNFNDDAGQL